MKNDLVFYTNPHSRGQIVRWMLEEIGAPYTTEIVEYGPPMKAEKFLNINPMGKVPAISQGEKVVTETAAICAYLADAFPEADLAPSLIDRAEYYRWLFFAAGPVEAAFGAKSLGFKVPEDKEAMIGYGNFNLVVDTLEQAVSDCKFLAGDKFSAADLYVGSHIGWGMQFGTIEKRAAFEKYWELVSDREAYRKAKEMDEAPLD